jgi:FG-GAP-like repeat
MKHTSRIVALALLCLAVLGTTTSSELKTDASTQLPLWQPFWSSRAFTVRCGTSVPFDSLRGLCTVDLYGDGVPGLLIAGTYPHILSPGLGSRFAHDLTVINPSMPDPYQQCDDHVGISFPNQDVLSGDLNHDGVEDVVAINSNGIRVYLGAYTPVRDDLSVCGEHDICTEWGFENPERGISTYPIASDYAFYHHAQLKDLDADGHLDIILVYWGELGVRYGDGHGGFSEEDLSMSFPGTPESALWGTFQESEGLWILTSEYPATEQTPMADDTGLWFLSQDTGEIEKILDVYGISLATGDFNGDGREDFTLITAINEFSIYLAEDDGFSLAQTIQIPRESGWVDFAFYVSVGVGDFNGDGYSDIVSLMKDPAQLRIYYNKGDASFHDPIQHLLEAPPELRDQLTGQGIIYEGITDFLIEDLNKDGGDDLVFLLDEIYVQVLVPSAIPLGYGLQYDRGYRQIHAADLDNDGVRELISIRESWTEGSCDQSDVSLFSFSTTGILQHEFLFRPASCEGDMCDVPRAITTAHLNDDGFLDIVVLSECDNDGSGAPIPEVSVWYGTGNRTDFNLGWTYTFSSDVKVRSELFVWDYNGDDRDDICVVRTSRDSMGILLAPSSDADPLHLEWLDITDIKLFGSITIEGQTAMMGVRPNQDISPGPYEIVLVDSSGIRVVAETDCFDVTSLISHDWTGDGVDDISFMGLRDVHPTSSTSIGFRRAWGHEDEAMAVVIGFFASTPSGEFTVTFRETENWPFGKRTYASQEPLLGDFDGDGDTDLAVKGRSLYNTNADVIVLLWQGGEFSQLATLHPIASGWLFSSDVNGDGKDEIIVDIWQRPLCILPLTEQARMEP